MSDIYEIADEVVDAVLAMVAIIALVQLGLSGVVDPWLIAAISGLGGFKIAKKWKNGG